MQNGRGNNMAKRDYVESSGNVFADLGIANPDEMLAKAELAIRIAEILRRRRLTQTQAAAVLGVDQPKVSALIRGRLSGFSIERLLRFLLRLGADVSITIKPRRNSHSRPGVNSTGRKGKSPRAGILTVEEAGLEKGGRSSRNRQRAA
jgi:predicted XRE-type DNA-binding protein